MKYLKLICAVILASSLVISCKPKYAEITPELFLEIENRVLSTDMKPETKEKILEEYGFTLKQYTDYEERVASEPELKAKIGELRLKGHQM